jgi:hypothetical protein
VHWQRIDTVALDVESGITSARALAITAALTRRAIPLLRVLDGRAEPLASAALVVDAGCTLLLTCRHVFDDGVTLDDLGVALAESGTVAWLRAAQARVLAHPRRDVALIAIGAARFADLLRRHWRAVPLATGAAVRACRSFVVAGYPYAQMRRRAAAVVARPLVLFARGTLERESLRVEYRRTARRIDGIEVHAPPLDGVSGALCWAITDERDDDLGCVLLPAAVQVAFKHDAYARAEPLTDLDLLTKRLRG